jgi:DNA-binding NarL/FixJ family response regulator
LQQVAALSIFTGTVMENKVIRVVVVEDQQQTREMLSMLINGDDELSCVAVFQDTEAAIAGIPDLCVDVALVDIHLPGGVSGIGCVSTLRDLCPDTEFVMCTSLEDGESIFSALQAGATGYITKSTAPEKIIEAIKDAHTGGAPMSSQIARKVARYFAEREKPRKNEELEKLSAREQEILEYLSRGFRYKEIAAALYVSVETVRKHIHNIYEKLQVNSRTDAINKVFAGK